VSSDPLAALAEAVDHRAAENDPGSVLVRLGNRRDPLGFPPANLCGWSNRWDDPLHEYRTLYCAPSAITCLREVLADFRPNTKVLVELEDLYGPDAPEMGLAQGAVSADWCRAHAFATGLLWSTGDLVDVDKPKTRESLMLRHASLLADRGHSHLDIADLRSRDRAVTQAISRSLFEEGAAGIRYRSNLDDSPCVALFEGRAGLYPLDDVVGLHPDQLAYLASKYCLQVRVEYGGHLDRRAMDRRVIDLGPPRAGDRRTGPDRRARAV
jgi:hypothetical protein